MNVDTGEPAQAKPTRLLEPITVTVLTTSRCTAQCRHCCMNSGPDRDETLSYEQMERILSQLFASAPLLHIVIFAGGEPLLLGEDLLKAIRFCKQNGKGSRVVTNGYWANSKEAAQETAKSLREAGLDEINISVDDFHLPWISLQRVRWAYEASLEAGFSAVVLASCSATGTVITTDRLLREFKKDSLKLRFDKEGHSIKPQPTAGEPLLMLSNSWVQSLGRGQQMLQPEEISPRPTEKEEPVGCPWALRTPAISPKGHLLSCCGFELEDNPVLDFGDTANEPVADILDRADRDVMTNLIAMLGPQELNRYLRKQDPSLPIKPSYRTHCEACSDLVNIPANREALLEHQAPLALMVAGLRDQLIERYKGKDGIVRLPPSQAIQITTGADKKQAYRPSGE